MIRGITTMEVMVMTLAITIVVISTFGAEAASFKAYQELIHRERALLYAVETIEELEAMKLTRVQQNYRSSWKNFLGNFDEGSYQFTVPLAGADPLSDLFLSKAFDNLDFENNAPSVVRIYEPEKGNDFYSRLERRMTIAPVAGSSDKRLVTVSVYWGIPGAYKPESVRQVSLQTVFADQVGPAFAM